MLVLFDAPVVLAQTRESKENASAWVDPDRLARVRAEKGTLANLLESEQSTFQVPGPIFFSLCIRTRV